MPKPSRKAPVTKQPAKPSQPKAPPSPGRAKPKRRGTRPTQTRAVRRVCILTGGGDAPGLNAVLRAFVKTGIGLGLEIYGSEDGFEGLIQPNRLVNLKLGSVRGILPRGGSILGCSNRANPFAYPTKNAKGHETFVDVSEIVLSRLRDHEIDVLVLVGGDGTMHHAAELQKRGVRVVGVPKTIDNDLAATDYTFGFDTAVTTATWAIDALHSTAESHDRVILLELMGRYAGWISLWAGIAGGADVICIPEIPYDLERVVAKVEERSRNGSTFSLIVVGEGAKPKGGGTSTIAKGRKGHLERLGGAAQMLADQLKDRIPHEVRVTVLGHLQRGGSPSPFDRLLGTRFGTEAAWLCHRGETGQMVALRGQDVVTVAITEAVDRNKLVDPDGPLVCTARAIGIELGA